MIYTYDDSENVQRPVQTFNGKGIDYVIHAVDYIFPGVIKELKR